MGNRAQVIIDYISENQGCTAQNIVDGVKDKISRKPVFDIIRQLTHDGVVRDDKVNRRDHRYFVSENNLLVTIPKELDEFARNYCAILEKVQVCLADKKLAKKLAQRFHWKSENRTPDNIHKLVEVHKKQLLDPAVDVFFAQVIRYNLRAISVWPSMIKDPEVLSKLYIVVFSKFNEIRNFLLQIYRTIFPGNVSYLEKYKVPIPTNELRFNFVGWKNGLLDVMNLEVRKEFNSIKDELEGIAFYPGDRF